MRFIRETAIDAREKGVSGEGEGVFPTLIRIKTISLTELRHTAVMYYYLKRIPRDCRVGAFGPRNTTHPRRRRGGGGQASGGEFYGL